MTKKIVVSGTRTYNDYGLLEKTLDKIAEEFGPDLEIVEGGAAGADDLAGRYAARHHIPLVKFPADWKKYGRGAGPVRNRQMLEYAGKDGLLVAFWDGKSRGTKNIIDTAQTMGLQTRVISSP